MISILYPKEDYTSADIAIKIQALAQQQPNTIFIVPKHFGRNEENVYKNLSTSTSGMLLLHDKRSLDAETRRELDYLIREKKKVFCIAPRQSQRYLKLPEQVTAHYFDPSKPGDFLATVQKISEDLKKRKDSGDFGMLLIMLALIMLIIAAFNDDKKK